VVKQALKVRKGKIWAASATFYNQTTVAWVH
jgi:hypothetical protein